MRRYLIERVSRNRAGDIARVGWCELTGTARQPLTLPLPDADVHEVVAVLHAGATVNVVVGFIIGQRVVVGPSGLTIVDFPDQQHAGALKLEDLPEV